MDNNKEFSYTYSAAVNKKVQEIRNKYIPKKESKLEELLRLDRSVQTSGALQALLVGIIGFLLFGLGICMSVGIIGDNMTVGIEAGTAGALIMTTAYPVYRHVFKKTKERLSPRILELTYELSATGRNTSEKEIVQSTDLFI